MRHMVVASSVAMLVGGFGCGEVSLSALPSTRGDIPVIAAPIGTTAADPESCAQPAAPRGAAVWRRDLAQDDVLKFTSVATDAGGNTLAARAAGETFKIDADGKVLWSKPLGSLVAADRSGNVFIAGTFTGTLDLGGRTLESAGGTDVYVARLNPNGDLLYGIALGAAGAEQAASLAIDSQGDAVVSGPGVGTVELDGTGRVRWKKDVFGSLAVDSSDDVLITGALVGVLTIGGTTLESAGGEDVFVAKFSSTGDALFGVRFGDKGLVQHGEGVTVDPSDNVLVSGVIDGVVDFGGGPLSVPAGTCSTEQWCELAGFVVKLDPSGHHVWSRSRAPVRSLPGIASDSEGRVAVSGAYPADAPPYRSALLLELTANGAEMPITVLDESGNNAAVGHRLAFDRCDNLIWAAGVAPTPGSDSITQYSTLMKLSL